MTEEDELLSFYADRSAGATTLLYSDPSYAERARAFAARLRGCGVTQSRIQVDDFRVFEHPGLREAIEGFIRDSPGAALPLESVTVVQYARRETCAEDLARTQQLARARQAQMTDFATRYNIDVRLHLFLQQFAAAPAAAIAGLAASPAVDEVGFFFDFAPLGAQEAAAVRRELAAFCDHACVRNEKVRLGNFPLCFYPPHAFKLAYRDALEPLKGHIGSQRHLLRELRARSFNCHEPCRACRCRAACYAYTGIGEWPDLAPVLEPRRQQGVVFAGGSVRAGDAPAAADLVWAAPAEQGDLLAALLEGFAAILVIDGYFYSKFPCTTFEVLLALEAGLHVFGAASIGALRAVELDRYGMRGTGYVYEYLKRQPVKPYHVVAQTYDAADRPLTPALIQILYFLERARDAGVLTACEFDAACGAAHDIPFSLLSFAPLFRRLSEAEGAGERIAGMLRAFLAAQGGPQAFDIKHQDALRLLGEFRAVLEQRPPQQNAARLASARDEQLSTLFGRYRRGHDLTLPEGWQAAGGESSPAGSRDRRACSAAETCARARRFFEGIELTLADTTRYDPAGSHVVSAILVPFYFLDYYPASATGNGAQFEDALASAYMELVERIPAPALHIAPLGRLPAGEPVFPAEQLPQYYNWGAPPAEKQSAIRDHGYVRVTDIVTGRPCHIPKAAVMFGYSGTDGSAAGNTLAEAVLYGLYELVERDTGQMHLVDSAWRGRLAEFQLDPAALDDPRCAALLAQAESRGCRMILFELPNLCGLPCVLCHAYDLDRGLQIHGGIAVRADAAGAAYAALHEATMQHITYFAGMRDDYRSFTTLKQARVAYENARQTFFGEPGRRPLAPPAPVFTSLRAELEHAVQRLTAAGISHILVANTSPRDEYEVKSVKVIVPGLDLWFCPEYQPSPHLRRRARLVEDALA